MAAVEVLWLQQISFMELDRNYIFQLFCRLPHQSATFKWMVVFRAIQILAFLWISTNTARRTSTRCWARWELYYDLSSSIWWRFFFIFASTAENTDTFHQQNWFCLLILINLNQNNMHVANGKAPILELSYWLYLFWHINKIGAGYFKFKKEQSRVSLE